MTPGDPGSVVSSFLLVVRCQEAFIAQGFSEQTQAAGLASSHISPVLQAEPNLDQDQQCIVCNVAGVVDNRGLRSHDW